MRIYMVSLYEWCCQDRGERSAFGHWGRTVSANLYPSAVGLAVTPRKRMCSSRCFLDSHLERKITEFLTVSRKLRPRKIERERISNLSESAWLDNWSVPYLTQPGRSKHFVSMSCGLERSKNYTQQWKLSSYAGCRT